jgi:hypothetical protein
MPLTTPAPLQVNNSRSTAATCTFPFKAPYASPQFLGTIQVFLVAGQVEPLRGTIKLGSPHSGSLSTLYANQSKYKALNGKAALGNGYTVVLCYDDATGAVHSLD